MSENHYLDMLYQDIDFVVSQLSIESQFYYVSLLKSFDVVYVKELPNGSPATANDETGELYITNDLLKYSVQQSKLILLHEVMHATFMHIRNRMNKNPIIWNYAADAVVNRYIGLDFGYDVLKELENIGMATDEVIASEFQIALDYLKNANEIEIYYKIMRSVKGISKGTNVLPEDNPSGLLARSKISETLKIKDIEDGEAVKEGRVTKGTLMKEGTYSNVIRNAATPDEKQNAYYNIANRIKYEVEKQGATRGKAIGEFFINAIKPVPSRFSLNSISLVIRLWYQKSIMQNPKRYNRRYPMLPSTAYVGWGNVYVLVDPSGPILEDELKKVIVEIPKIVSFSSVMQPKLSTIIILWDPKAQSIKDITKNLDELKVIEEKDDKELAPALKQLIEKYRLRMPLPQMSRPMLIIFSDFRIKDKEKAKGVLNILAPIADIVQVSYSGRFLDDIYSIKLTLGV